ncbi:TPA: hypothetical protein HA241_04005 [Candidatus Woesearchaeota archaeon]|nr:hypothetical protein [Candidatus Woesearchaeota archaeon]
MRTDQLRHFVTQLTPDELVYLLYSHEIKTKNQRTNLNISSLGMPQQ